MEKTRTMHLAPYSKNHSREHSCVHIVVGLDLPEVSDDTSVQSFSNMGRISYTRETSHPEDGLIISDMCGASNDGDSVR